MIGRVAIIMLCAGIVASAQNKDDFKTGNDQKSGSFLDPSRFSIRNSVSFGAMSGSGMNNLQTQSMYTTMMQYKFTAPVTLNLNFALPIHSTFAASQNLTPNNLQSLDYFRSMPFEASLSWQPTQNTMFQLSIMKMGSNYSYLNDHYGLFRNDWDSFYSTHSMVSSDNVRR
jgi:hypothetical protein